MREKRDVIEPLASTGRACVSKGAAAAAAFFPFSPYT